MKQLKNYLFLCDKEEKIPNFCIIGNKYDMEGEKKIGDDFMSSTLVQFRTDENSKTKAVLICKRLGLDLPSYLRMCISRLNQENGIPFSMNINNLPQNKGLEAMKAASMIAEEYGIADMTLDEINAEIAEARKPVLS